MSHLCIYHKNCPDGFGAALSVKVFLDREFSNEPQEWLAAHHDDLPPNVAGKNVYIVDFAYKRDVLLKLKQQAKTLQVIDHHVTAKNDLDGLDFCVFDMNKSGAYLSWQFFNPNLPVPKLIEYIQDRDLWRWQLPNSKAFSAGLELHQMEFDLWLPLLNDGAVKAIIEQGKVVLAYQQIEIEKALKKGFELVDIAGYQVPCLNTTVLISDIGDRLCKGYPFAAMYFESKDKRVYSLRSDEQGIDVSKVAEKFGGGGHPRAAGFIVKKSGKKLSV